jgi:hypothetical protein
MMHFFGVTFMSNSRNKIQIPCAAAVYTDSFDPTPESQKPLCNILLIGDAGGASNFSSYFPTGTSDQVGIVVDASVKLNEQDQTLYMLHNTTHKSSTYPTFWDDKASYTHDGNIMFFFGAEGLRILQTLSRANAKIEAFSLDLMSESQTMDVTLKPMKQGAVLTHSVQHDVPAEAGAKKVYQAFFDLLPKLKTMAAKESDKTLRASNL